MDNLYVLRLTHINGHLDYILVGSPSKQDAVETTMLLNEDYDGDILHAESVYGPCDYRSAEEYIADVDDG